MPIARRDLLLLGTGAALASTLASTGPADAADRYEDPDAVYAAIRDQPHTRLRFGASAITVVFADEAIGVDRSLTLAWIRRAAQAMTGYFGRFPIADYGLLVIAEPSDRIGHATTFGYAGSITRIHVGTRAPSAAFARDWILVHEMMHAAMPDLPRRALWLQEGNATYLEPLARARAGQVSAGQVWREMIAGMPKGEPRTGDGAIDGTRAWARLYWGGATFWLLAEVAIFEQSYGRRTLRDALRATNRASGGNAATWSPEKWMRAGDAAIGANAMTDLYARFLAGPVRTDLPALFARFGVMALPNGAVAFDDSAPLAALRRAMTA